MPVITIIKHSLIHHKGTTANLITNYCISPAFKLILNMLFSSVVSSLIKIAYFAMILQQQQQKSLDSLQKWLKINQDLNTIMLCSHYIIAQSPRASVRKW